MKNSKVYSYLALMVSILGCAWAVLVNIWSAWLFGFAAFVLYLLAQKADRENKLNRIVLYILIGGVAVTAIGLLFLFSNG